MSKKNLYNRRKIARAFKFYLIYKGARKRIGKKSKTKRNVTYKN